MAGKTRSKGRAGGFFSLTNERWFVIKKSPLWDVKIFFKDRFLANKLTWERQNLRRFETKEASWKIITGLIDPILEGFLGICQKLKKKLTGNEKKA
jgi:hypothetical protein